VGVLLSYITGSAFLYMDRLRMSPARFALVFGLGASGFIAATQCNRLFLRRWSLEGITRTAVRCSLACCLVLNGLLIGGNVSFAPIFGILVLLQASLGCAFPNVGALVFATVREAAGSASAVQGMLQSLVGAIAAALVARLGNGAVLPMALVMAGFALGASVLLRFAVPRRSVGQGPSEPSAAGDDPDSTG